MFMVIIMALLLYGNALDLDSWFLCHKLSVPSAIIPLEYSYKWKSPSTALGGDVKVSLDED